MFFKLNITRAKQAQGENIRRLARQEALEQELNDLQCYLYSAKFAQDTTVQVQDIATRLTQLSNRAHYRGDQAADRFFTDLKVDLVKKAMAREGYSIGNWELVGVDYPQHSWPVYTFRDVNTVTLDTAKVTVEWRYIQ